MHAVSLTPHAQKNFLNNFENWKSYAKQGWYAKKIKNACGVNDTPSMIPRYSTHALDDDPTLFEHSSGPIPGYAAKPGIGPALCGIVWDQNAKFQQNVSALCGTALNHGPVLCGIVLDHDPALCRSAGSKGQTWTPWCIAYRNNTVYQKTVHRWPGWSIGEKTEGWKSRDTFFF
jgi:hypothetical protein